MFHHLWQRAADASLCYIDDLVAGLIRLMAAAPVTGPQINLGNSNLLSPVQLSKAARDLAQCQRLPAKHIFEIRDRSIH
jgi:nucleoside-diphosphate-sugar epimerase